MPKSIETTKLRNNLASAIADVNKKKDFLIVTKSGKPVAGLVNLDLLEDIEAANSPAFIKSIKEAREQVKRGEFYTHEEVFGDLWLMSYKIKISKTAIKELFKLDNLVKKKIKKNI